MAAVQMHLSIANKLEAAMPFHPGGWPVWNCSKYLSGGAEQFSHQQQTQEQSETIEGNNLMAT